MGQKQIFEETTLGNLKLKNRLIRSATWEGMADHAGHMPEELYNVYAELAQGGVGGIISGFTSVSDNDFAFGGMARLSSDELIPDHNRLTQLVHQDGCPILAQLALGEYNRGSVRDMAVDNMTAEDIITAKGLFVAAADRAAKAGYDGVQIHGAHGFFLSRFLSPGYNHRTDTYGGGVENRSRIIVEMIQEIHSRNPQLHICMKINCHDYIYGGLTPAESLVICKLCAEVGIDSIEVSGNGTSVPGIRPGVNEAYFKDFALRLAEEVNIPILLVGGLRSLECMEKVLNDGRISFLSLSRPLIREPDLPNRWQSGDRTPSKCMSCNVCYQTSGHQCIQLL